jgi:hypothetical protein
VVREALARPQRRHRTNRLSAFGQAFSAAFSHAPSANEAHLTRGRRVADIPIYQSEAHYALYRRLIRPYARGDARAPRHEREVLFVRSPFMTVAPGEVHCDDPLWAARAVLDACEERVVAALLRAPFATVRELRSALRDDAHVLDAALAQLCSDGMVVASAHKFIHLR